MAAGLNARWKPLLMLITIIGLLVGFMAFDMQTWRGLLGGKGLLPLENGEGDYVSTEVWKGRMPVAFLAFAPCTPVLCCRTGNNA